jgi:hypothetical protein
MWIINIDGGRPGIAFDYFIGSLTSFKASIPEIIEAIEVLKLS